MPQRTIRTERKINNYASLSPEEHVYKRIEMYGGSDKRKNHDDLIYDNEKLVIREIKTPEALKRTIHEILSNATDNADASRRAGVDPGKLEITADSKTIRVKNGGIPIPVEKVVLEKNGSQTNMREFKEGQDQEFTWLPAYIFGHLRSSNNYDDENTIRTGAGRNGIGAKLTNILSKRFIVEIEDSNTKRRFKAIWKDNMFKETPGTKPEVEVIEDKEIKTSSVTIEWELDFERFKMKQYGKEDLALFCRFAIDYSFAGKIVTTFNGVELDYRDIHKFATLFFSQEVIDKSIVKYSWNKMPKDLLKNGDTVLTKKIVEAKKAEHIPEIEVMYLDDPDNGKVISYVNGLVTVDGGVHVDCVQEPVIQHICQLVNGDKKKKDKNLTISARYIKPHMSIIVNARLLDTEYNSQSKTKLTSPEPHFEIEENKIKKVNDWDMIKRLHAELEALAFRTASKGDGKKTKHIKEEKGFNANKAGTRESLKCALYIVEGKSAASYPRRRISLLKGAKNYNGLAILKGKLMNITNARAEKYANNKVFAYLKQMIGLKEGVDYNAKINLQTLRYGFLIINVDADDDGYHILAHFLNFLREKFPGILKQNMVSYLRTPVIKLLKNDKIVHRFFTNTDFKRWQEKNSLKGFEVRYYKGLASSEPTDVEDDLKTAPTVYCIYDDKSNQGFDLAFHKSNTDRRKEWIAKWRDVTQIDDIVSVDLDEIIKDKKTLTGAQDISHFLNRELVNYSVASLFRAIPSEYDHLKNSQRKALYASLVYFNYNPKAKEKRIKVGRLANKAADMTEYHHGEKSLIDTFIKMTQDFVGSNNMGFFYQGGGFGTREDGGDEAGAARYVFTHLSWWIPFVYYKESVDLIKKQVVDGEECEPEWLPGVIPMGIVNGTYGIATGYSTSTPCHHPIEVIEWYEKKCRGEETEPLIPWFNKFEGKREIKVRDDSYEVEREIVMKDEAIEALEKTSEMLEDEEIERDDNENLALLKHAEKSKLSLRTYGKYEFDDSTTNDVYVIRITELPIKTWSDNYKDWLNSIVTSKAKDKAILDFDNNSTPEKVNFIIQWNKNYPYKPNIKTLKLVRSFGLTNITLIDHRGFPIRYDRIDDVMHKYFEHMLQHYQELREFRITNEENNVRDISYMIKFIVCKMKGELKIDKVKEEDIKAQMEKLEIPYRYLDKSKTRDFTEESLTRQKKNLAEARERLEKAKKTAAQDIWLNKLAILKKEVLKRKVGKFFNFSK